MWLTEGGHAGRPKRRGSKMDIPEVIVPLAGMLMVLGIIGIVFWFKGREKELHCHQDLRIREMEHLQKMKQLELEIERTKKA